MRAARRQWAASQIEEGYDGHQPLELGEVSSLVVRHPAIGTTFVAVHATTSGFLGVGEFLGG